MLMRQATNRPIKVGVVGCGVVATAYYLLPSRRLARRSAATRMDRRRSTPKIAHKVDANTK